MTTRASAGRIWAFVVIAVFMGALTWWSLGRARDEVSSASLAESVSPVSSAAAPSAPFVLVRHLGTGPTWGRLAAMPLGALDGPRHHAALACLRSHMGGARGICLTPTETTGRATIFDDRFRAGVTLPLTGAPSRARVTKDGRRAAVTVFEHGHSYADTAFSTRTTIVDLATGTEVTDLERFTAWQGKTQVKRVDVNYWGVTFFDDGNRFYATLRFGGTPYLVEGNVDAREVHVREADVECPSLSPDATRIAFKRAEGFGWRLWVMDLATRQARPLGSETRSIDDQVEWLDETHVLYQHPTDAGNHVWVASVDTDERARVFVRDAWSPAVVR